MDDGYMAAGHRVFDYGSATIDSSSRLREGQDALLAGCAGEKENGNGSLMRLLPLSLWTCGLPVPEQVALSHDCSRITHAHPRSQACCALYSLLVRSLIAGTPSELAWDDAVSRLRDTYRGTDGWGEPFMRELELVDAFNKPSGSGYVVDTLRSAWLAFFGAGDYVSAVRTAVRFGHDTDTTACVAGGLAGLKQGPDSIPGEWLSGLRIDDEVRDVISAFVRNCPRD